LTVKQIDGKWKITEEHNLDEKPSHSSPPVR
jgi:hypothetical protein